MKKPIVFFTALFALTVSAEVLAQVRGPRYNPPSRSGGPASRPTPSAGRPSSSSSHGPRYNPPGRPSGSSSSSRPSRPSSSSSSRPSRPSSSSGSYTGPRYNPPSSSSGSGPSSGTYTGPSYNPPSSTTTAPRYNPPARSGPYHGSRPVIVGPRYHNPVTGPVRVIRWPAPRDYYSNVGRHHIYRRWVLFPVMFTYGNGYWAIDGYPYYVHNGYRHRYNLVEKCQYQLIDGNDYTVVKDFGIVECNAGYDACATERDALNRPLGVERFFCAEAVDEDLQNTNTDEYSPYPVTMDAAKKAAVSAYLSGMSFAGLWEDGYKGGVGSCLIYKLRGNEHGCKWTVTVGDEYYPNTNGEVCSATASLVGCDVGDEKDNVGCILKQAVQEGLCH
jgi:hypothetical protein